MSLTVLGYAIGLIALGTAGFAHIEASSYLQRHLEDPAMVKKLRRLTALKWGAIGVVIAVIILELAAN